MANPKTPKLFTTPKSWLILGGKPLFSSINTPTSKISEFVGFHLQPNVTEIPSYV